MAPPLLAAWRPGLLGAPPAAYRASEGLGLGARVRGSACDSIRCGEGNEEVKWCTGAGAAVRGAVVVLVQWAGAWWADAQRLSAHGLSLPYESFSVLRFGME